MQGMRAAERQGKETEVKGRIRSMVQDKRGFVAEVLGRDLGLSSI